MLLNEEAVEAAELGRIAESSCQLGPSRSPHEACFVLVTHKLVALAEAFTANEGVCAAAQLWHLLTAYTSDACRLGSASSALLSFSPLWR